MASGMYKKDENLLNFFMQNRLIEGIKKPPHGEGVVGRFRIIRAGSFWG
jgi:hypothetical protein